MELWGITGTAGSGKSEVLRILRSRGLAGIDADAVAREVIDPRTEPGRNALVQVFKEFGSELRTPDGSLDRRALRDMIISDSRKRLALEALLHPLITEAIRRRVADWRAEGRKVAFVEGTKLLESGVASDFTGLVLVTAPEALRVARIVKRDAVGEPHAQAILRAQDESGMRAVATEEWHNDGSPEQLEAKTIDFLKRRGIE